MSALEEWSCLNGDGADLQRAARIPSLTGGISDVT